MANSVLDGLFSPSAPPSRISRAATMPRTDALFGPPRYDANGNRISIFSTPDFPEAVAPPVPESRIARAASLLGAGARGVGNLIGTPARGLGLLADLAQESALGIPDELSRVKFNRPVQEGGPISDVFEPGISAPSAGQVSLEGLEMLAGLRHPAINRPGAIVPVEEDSVQQAIRRSPILSRVNAVAEPLAELGTSFGTDPALGLLGAAGNGGRIARAAERLIGAGLVPGMAAGAIQSGQAFARAGAQNGYTSPEALRAGTQTGIDAILAGVGLHRALRPGEGPRALEGEYIPPPAPEERLRLEAPPIDIEGRTVGGELPPGSVGALPPAPPPAPIDRQLGAAFSSVPLQPPVDASGLEGRGVAPGEAMVPTPGGSLLRQRVYQAPEAEVPPVAPTPAAAADLAATDALAAQGLPSQRSAIARAAAKMAAEQAARAEEDRARQDAETRGIVRDELDRALNPTGSNQLGEALGRRRLVEANPPTPATEPLTLPPADGGRIDVAARRAMGTPTVDPVEQAVRESIPAAITALERPYSEPGGKVFAGTEHITTHGPVTHPAKTDFGLDDLPEGAGRIADALRRDRGNPLEMRARDAMARHFEEQGVGGGTPPPEPRAVATAPEPTGRAVDYEHTPAGVQGTLMPMGTPTQGKLEGNLFEQDRMRQEREAAAANEATAADEARRQTSLLAPPAERRQQQVPVAQERRTRIAEENGLTPEHPAVERIAQLEEQQSGERDQLTGLLSKAAWDARPNPKPASLSVDIANFKAINDRYGHDNADLIIKALGEGLGQIAGPGRAARPHGDEMLADFDTIEQAQEAAARLHLHAASLRVEVAMPDGSRETVSGIRVHTGTGVARENLTADKAADFDLNQRAEAERLARPGGRGLAAEAPRAPAAGGPDRVGEAGRTPPAAVAAAPPEVAPPPPAAAAQPEPTPEAHVAEAAARVEPSPSPAQMEAGNYRKGHMTLHGLDITLETPKGGTRVGKDGSWSVENFPAHYGYVKGTEGKDGDHVDVYVGDDLASERVWVVDQIDPKTKAFDEHKAMLAFPDQDAAIRAYDAAFNDGSGPRRREAVTEVPVQQFKAWLANGDTKAPFADQVTGTVKKADIVPTRAGVQAIEKPEAKGFHAPEPTEEARARDMGVSVDEYRRRGGAVSDPAGVVPGTADLVKRVAGVLDDFNSGRRTARLDNTALTAMADEAFGGTRGQGKYTPRDAYDAVETAVNTWVEKHGARLLREDPEMALRELRGITKRLPTQTDRTREQVEFQQFSTPPTEAYVAARALAIRPGETVLEPSAGVGGLAVWAKAAGGDVKVNEIAPRRAGLLKLLGFEPTSVDAEHLNDVLPDEIQPTAILMNPPFSATGGRVQAHRTSYGAAHVEQALERLAPGGRLVAIVGQGMAFEGGTPRGTGHQATGAAFRDWWAGIMDRYNVRANLGVPGEEYGKYGTTFGNQIIVIDKTGPTPGTGMADRLQNVKWGRISSLEEAVDALRDVTADRPSGAHGEPGAEGVAPNARGAVEPNRAGVPGEPGHAEAPGGRLGNGTRAGRPGGAAGDTGIAPRGVPEGEPGSGPGAAAEGPVPARPGRPPNEPRAVAPAEEAPPEEARAAAPTQATSPVERETEAGGTFVRYKPTKIETTGLAPHPADVVEAASMAAVEPPEVTYRSSLPAEVLQQGRLSDLQYESVLYAGQRHEQTLPDGARAGYFIGDGTGVGKGREIAGIVLDNWQQGRKKTLWVSVSRDLIEAARDDLDSVAGKGKIPIRSVNDFPAADAIDAPAGVVFTTYNSLISKSKGEKGQSRQAQIEKWLGKEGGTIVFDEAHKAKNALAAGRAEPTQTGRAVIELQRNLPGARVVYVSATGATDVRNMAYMTRLGLWAPEQVKPGLGGTVDHEAVQRAQEASGKFAFPGGFNEFLNEVEQGGVGAKEMVSRDLKALGMYASRSISFKGVEYREKVHELTPAQRQMYDAGAKAWQVVLQNIDQAIGITKASNAARTAAMKRFWNDHQRFFRQVTTAMKMPSVIAEVEDALRAGQSAIVTLKGTGESKTAEQVSKASAAGQSLDELDFTPRETLAQMVESAFPTQVYEDVADPNNPSKTIRVAAVRDGKPVISKEAVALKKQVLEGLSDLHLPDNPLDQFINHFGADKVAEMTGRQKRLVRDPRTGKTEYVKRSGNGVGSDKVNLHEMEQFQGGKKRIAIISRAASTGISLHSSRRAKNQERRRQIAAELDWSADSEMQTFGRSHRSDQASPPIYVLVSTDVGGEKRFSSTIARRLASLGALTKGQRDATGGGDLAKYNFETPEGEAALENVYNALEGHRGGKAIAGIEDGPKTLEDMGLIKKDEQGRSKGLDPKDKRDVPRFLNRILALDLNRQNALFADFTRLFDEQVMKAKEEGTFDEGVADITGTSIRVKGEPDLIHTDETTGAQTKHITLDVDKPTTPMTWKDVERQREGNTATDPIHTYDKNYQVVKIEPGYYKQARSGNVILATPGGTRTASATGETRQMMRVMRPKGQADLVPALEVHEKYTPILADEAKGLWNEAVAKIPKSETVQEHVIAGSILPIWQRIKAGEGEHLKIVRATADDGRRVVGVRIPEAEVGRVLQNLGVGRSFESPEDVFRTAFLEGTTVALSEGLALRKTRVHSEDRLELTGVKATRFDQLRRMGLIEEKIDYRNRFFVPTDEAKGLDVIKGLMNEYPPPATAGEAATAGKSLSDLADEARARLRNRGGSGEAFGGFAAAGEGAAAFRDATVIGADLFARGVRRFGPWSKLMLKQVGNGVRSVLRQVYDKARDLFQAHRRGAGAAQEAAGAPPAAEAGAAAGGAEPPPKRPKGGIPFIITETMKARLKGLGYSDGDIGRLTPEQAWQRIESNQRRTKPIPPDQGPVGKSRQATGAPPRVQENEANLGEAEVRSGTSGRSMGGQEPVDHTPETQADLDARRKTLRGKTDDFFYNAMNRRTLDAAESQEWDSRVQGKKIGMDKAQRSLDDALGRDQKDTGELAQDVIARTLDYVAAQRAYVGDGREAARALGARARIQAADITASNPDGFMRKLFREIPNISDDQVADLLRTFKTDPGALPDLIRAAIKPTFRQKFFEAWRAGMLGPTSWIAKTSGDAAAQALSLARSIGGVAIERGVAAVKGRAPDREWAEAYGHIQALKDGVPLMLHTFLDRLQHEQFDVTGHYDTRAVGAIGKVNIGGKEVDAGRAIRTPYRIFEGITQAFSQLSGRTEVYRLAARKAIAEGRAKDLSDGDLSDFVERRAAEIRDALIGDDGSVRDTSEGRKFRDIEDAAIRAGKYNTYQKDYEPGGFWDRVAKVRTAKGIGGAIAETILPFYKVPLNIGRMAAEHTPFNFPRLLYKIRKGELAGGAAAEEMVKPILGTLVGVAFAAAAKAGLVTGAGPTDPREKKNLLDTGWQPYSFHVGDKYISYHRLEPLATIAGTAADLVESHDEKTRTDMVKKILASVAQNWTDKTFFQGLSEATGAINDPFRFVPQLVKGIEGSLVPSILAKAAQAIDPTIRETSATDLSPIEARIPFLSKRLKPQREATGLPAERPDTGVAGRVYNALSPFPVSSEQGGAVHDLERVFADVGYVPSTPPRSIAIPGSGGRKLQLTDDEYERLQNADEATSQRVSRVVNSPGFRKLDPLEQKDYLQRQYARAGIAAEKSLYALPSFRARVIATRRGGA